MNKFEKVSSDDRHMTVAGGRCPGPMSGGGRGEGRWGNGDGRWGNREGDGGYPIMLHLILTTDRERLIRTGLIQSST